MDNFVMGANMWSELAEINTTSPGKHLLCNAVAYLLEEAKETQQAEADYAISDIKSIDSLIDGFADTAFVAVNGIYKIFRLLGEEVLDAHGKTSECLRRLLVANVSKLSEDGLVMYDENGKVKKPENFVPPTYTDLIKLCPLIKN